MDKRSGPPTGLSVTDGSVTDVGPLTVSGLDGSGVAVTVTGPVVPVRLNTTTPASNLSPTFTKRGTDGCSMKGLRTSTAPAVEPKRSAPAVATARIWYDVSDCGSFTGTVALPLSPTSTDADHTASVRKSGADAMAVSESPPPPPGTTS